MLLARELPSLGGMQAEARGGHSLIHLATSEQALFSGPDGAAGMQCR